MPRFLPGERWWLDAPGIWGPTWGLPWPIWGPPLPEIEPRAPRGGGGGGTFGPIAGPVDIPPPFGPIAGPVDIPPTFGPIADRNRRRNAMPFSLIGDLVRGRIPGLPPIITLPPITFPPITIPGTRPPEVMPGPTPGVTMPGRVTRGVGCAPCVIEKQMPAYTRKMKGRAVFHPQTGQFLGCTPARRSINPMNGKAAIRAARRLKGVFKFQRRVEKALQKACRGSGVRRTSSRSCKKKC